jgi:hypothetical protein
MLLRRTRVPQAAPRSTSIIVINDSDANAKLGKNKKPKRSTLGFIVKLIICVCAISILCRLGFTDPDKDMDALLKESQKYITEVLEEGYKLMDAGTVDLDTNIHLDVDFAIGDEPNTVTLGPHTAYITFGPACKRPRFWMRMEGEALVAVNLERDHPGVNKWNGKFSLPKSGTYQVVTHWFGCDGTSEKKVIKVPDINAVGTSSTAVAPTLSSSLYPNSVWLYINQYSKYVWTNAQVPVSKTKFQKLSKSVLAWEGTVGRNGFYNFAALSTPEHICWIGSASAERLQSAFLEIQPIIAGNLKTAMFQYYRMDSFINPDRDWTEVTKGQLRFCKVALISMDEPREPLSQMEYKSQVETFLGHMVKVMPDDSLPIYMHTVMESPESTNNCHSPELAISSDHPCNVALKELFNNNNNSPTTTTLPKRVLLLDNTDLTLPQLGENMDEVTTVIALRDVVNVGKKCKEWRLNGQHGVLDGVMRKGEKFPFHLGVYTDWN